MQNKQQFCKEMKQKSFTETERERERERDANIFVFWIIFTLATQCFYLQ